jgi:hypothetical protein
VSVSQALERHGVCPLFRYAGDPPRPIEPAAFAIADYIAQVRQDRARFVPAVFRLSSEPAAGPAIFLDFDTTLSGPVDVIWVSLPNSFLEAAGATETLVELHSEMCVRFGAYHGALEDELLMHLYRGRRASERARSAVPPELRRFVPGPPIPPAANTFPSLLVPQEFDRRKVPDAVWWMNFWDAVQVETVQLSRVETAGFARVVPQPSGALFLLASEHAIDPNSPSDLQHLSHIVEHLELRRLQESAGAG